MIHDRARDGTGVGGRSPRVESNPGGGSGEVGEEEVLNIKFLGLKDDIFERSTLRMSSTACVYIILTYIYISILIHIHNFLVVFRCVFVMSRQGIHLDA